MDPTIVDVAREWAAKILGSRTTAPWMLDYLPADIESRATSQMNLVRELLPDAVRVWASRNAKVQEDITEEVCADMAAAMTLAVHQAAEAQATIDAETIELAEDEEWAVPLLRLL